MKKDAATATREFRRFLLMAQFEAREIGARIAQARKEAGLTQEQLAEMSPFSTRSLQNYERGEVIPYKQLRDISKILGRPVEWFLRGEKEDEPEVLEQLGALRELVAGVDRKLDVANIDQRLSALERDVSRILAAVGARSA